MNKLQFEQEYYSEWCKPSPKYDYAFKKWLQYYYETEVYDRRICSGINEKTGNAIPTSTVEYIDINRNAKRLMNVIVSDFHEKEIKKETWQSARDAASRFSHTEVQNLLNQLSQ